VAVGGAPVVDVAGGQSLNLSGGLAVGAAKTLTKSGDGTLRIGGAQNHGAGATLVAKQGTVQLDSNAGAANSAAGSNLAVSVTGNTANTASTVTLNADQDLGGLIVATADAGTQTFNLNSPATAGAFRSVRVYAADLNAAKASLYGAIRNANAAGAADPLDGIIDSGLHAGAGIGIAAIGDHILIRPTKKGDLNLDGQVTISDFIDLASNFNASGKTWQEGDLNYDGSVTISDFIDLASNFNSSYAGTVGAISASDQLTLASFASSIGADPSIIGSAVPEPAALSLLAVGALGLMRRRRGNRGNHHERITL
jgi:autotransporter-associated beta strand protein